MTLSNDKIFGFSSEPNALVFRVSAPLVAGNYTWLARNKVAASPQVHIDETDVWYINGFTYSVDIDELDYQAAIDSAGDQVPVFRLFQDASNKTPILQQQLVVAQYYQFVPYRKFVKPRVVTGRKGQKLINQLRGSFDGVIAQLPSMIGKSEVNLIFTFFLQDVRDQQDGSDISQSRTMRRAG